MQLMRRMLRKGVVEAPFTRRPQPGLLPVLPAFMSVLYNDYNSTFDVHNQSDRGPSAASGTSCAHSLYPLQLNLNEKHEKPRDMFLYSTGNMSPSSPSHSLTSFPPASDTQIPLFNLNPISRSTTTPSDDDDTNQFYYMVRLRHDQQTTDSSTNSFGLCTAKDGGDIPRSVYRDASYHKSDDREAELRSKIFEERWQEERLRMEQKHQAKEQQILDRKNAEIEELKGRYHVGRTEQEEALKKVKRKMEILKKRTCKCKRE